VLVFACLASDKRLEFGSAQSDNSMGNSQGIYKEEFPKGSMVKIASLPFLENFLKTWTFHHKLEPAQLEFADKVAEVEWIGFYHGGDVLYTLIGVPGIWHERCLEAAPLGYVR
jgi:hypothetical protein